MKSSQSKQEAFYDEGRVSTSQILQKGVYRQKEDPIRTVLNPSKSSKLEVSQSQRLESIMFESKQNVVYQQSKWSPWSAVAAAAHQIRKWCPADRH